MLKRISRSKSRTTKRRRSSGNITKKIIAMFVVFLGMLSLISFMIFSSKKADVDFATQCSNTTPLNTTVVFVDDTTPLSESQALRAKNVILQEAKVESNTHQLILVSLSNVLNNSYENIGCLARNPNDSDINELTVNKSQLAKQRDDYISRIESWTAESITTGSYSKYLKDWSKQFTESDVVVTSTDNEVRIVLSESITFDTGSDKLNFAGKSIIENLAVKLSNNPEFTINVIGHTDNKGSDAINQKLSSLRAENVAEIFVTSGLSMGEVATRGRGSLEPVASNETEDGRRLNRRIEVTLAPKRQILEALDRTFALINNDFQDGEINKLVIISDMAQSSASYSIYTGQTWFEFLNTPQGQTLNLSQENVDIHLHRILRVDTVASESVLLDFWRNYFDKKKVRLNVEESI